MKFLAFFLLALFAVVSVSANDACSDIAFVIGPCRAKIDAYSYNFVNNECEYFGYGGCQGTSNRFDTKEACEAACKH